LGRFGFLRRERHNRLDARIVKEEGNKIFATCLIHAIEPLRDHEEDYVPEGVRFKLELVRTNRRVEPLFDAVVVNVHGGFFFWRPAGRPDAVG
jgi:hypothetical protein